VKNPYWFKRGDSVVVAWAETFNGPGWTNPAIRVLVLSATDMKYRVEILQPDDHTAEMHTLRGVSIAASGGMTNAVRRRLEPKRRPAK
jgi:hypothetical protein